ncbi:MAG: ATP synthase subunit C [Verrucomicrobiota bacterium]|jgi:V/A-type H+-transporting ATPase subunit K
MKKLTMMKLTRWIIGAVLAGAALWGTSAMAAEVQQAGSTGDQTSVYRTIGLGLAAAISVGLSVLGAGIAVGRIGSAAVGAIAEKPELLPRAILFVALGEGLAILGFAFAMMLLQKM